MANSFLKDNQLRLFLTDAKKTGREPELCGRILINQVLHFIAVWKNKSRRTGEDFYKGLIHIDGQRGTNIGAISIYKNKFYTSGSDKLPLFYGRLKVEGKEYKVHLWEKKRENRKPFYSGIIRLITS